MKETGITRAYIPLTIAAMVGGMLIGLLGALLVPGGSLQFLYWGLVGTASALIAMGLVYWRIVRPLTEVTSRAVHCINEQGGF